MFWAYQRILYGQYLKFLCELGLQLLEGRSSCLAESRPEQVSKALSRKTSKSDKPRRVVQAEGVFRKLPPEWLGRVAWRVGVSGFMEAVLQQEAWIYTPHAKCMHGLFL